MFYVEHFSVDIKNKLNIYFDILCKWQKAINLVSRGTLENFWQRHIIDSLQLIPFIKKSKIIDLGSGGGFPGLVLAIVGQDLEMLKRYKCEADSLEVTCIDSDYRKTAFLSEVARLTDTKVRIINDRVENIDEKFDIVTARGFSELKLLLPFVQKYFSYGVFLKGKNIQTEIDKAKKDFLFNYDLFDSVTDENGHIIVVRDIERIIK